MKFEVVESDGEWIVLRDGEEAARFACQEAALRDVAARLRQTELGERASLAMGYEPKAG